LLLLLLLLFCSYGSSWLSVNLGQLAFRRSCAPALAS
jgi:hypothetical protein